MRHREAPVAAYARALCAVGVGVLVTIAPAVRAETQAQATAPTLARQRELVRLLHRDCGACHGLRLTGGLGPPLTRGALRDKPDETLTTTIMFGRAGTPMPPWRPFMTEAEAAWLVAHLKQGEADAR
ncbi:MAG: c-type cytochrome [Betaproteobacteria bacterium]